MARKLRVALEVGPKGKKFAAVARDWPALERGGKTEEAATEQLVAYLPRYAKVATLAKMGSEFSTITSVGEVERHQGTDRRTSGASPSHSRSSIETR